MKKKNQSTEPRGPFGHSGWNLQCYFIGEYTGLIKDIVKESELYTSKHQQILKDRRLLTVLLEVTADPGKYYNYEQHQNDILPSSFINIIKKKLKVFYETMTYNMMDADWSELLEVFCVGINLSL